VSPPPRTGIQPLLSDAELTLAMMQAILGFTSKARWLRHARAHLQHIFPYLPKQPGYNKRLRKRRRPGLSASLGNLPGSPLQPRALRASQLNAGPD
jgi:hypothetical protein